MRIFIIKKLVSMIAVLILLGIIIGPAHAATLQYLLDGGYITAGDLFFSDWHIINSSIDDLEMIEVTPLEDQELNSGLRFEIWDQQMAVYNGGIELGNLNFRVTTMLGCPDITDSSLRLTGWWFEGDRARVFVEAEDLFDTIWYNDVWKEWEMGVVEDETLYDYQVFEPHDELYTEIEAYAYAWDGSSVSLNRFEVRYSQTPIPSAILLLGSGLIGIVGIRRKIRL